MEGTMVDNKEGAAVDSMEGTVVVADAAAHRIGSALELKFAMAVAARIQ